MNFEKERKKPRIIEPEKERKKPRIIEPEKEISEAEKKKEMIREMFNFFDYQKKMAENECLRLEKGGLKNDIKKAKEHLKIAEKAKRHFLGGKYGSEFDVIMFEGATEKETEAKNKAEKISDLLQSPDVSEKEKENLQKEVDEAYDIVHKEIEKKLRWKNILSREELTKKEIEETLSEKKEKGPREWKTPWEGL